MPEHTESEFKEKNKYGHRSRSDKNQRRDRSSSPPKHIGNVKSHRNYCTHCAPSLACKMEKKFDVQEETQEMQKMIKKMSLDEILEK